MVKEPPQTVRAKGNLDPGISTGAYVLQNSLLSFQLKICILQCVHAIYQPKTYQGSTWLFPGPLLSCEGKKILPLLISRPKYREQLTGALQIDWIISKQTWLGTKSSVWLSPPPPSEPFQSLSGFTGVEDCWPPIPPLKWPRHVSSQILLFTEQHPIRSVKSNRVAI